MVQITSKQGTTPALILQGASGQTADFFDAYSNGGSLLTNINASGDICILMATCTTTAGLQVGAPALFQNATNSTTAFQVQNSGAINLLGVDTSGNNVYIGSTGSSALASNTYIGTSTSTTNAQTITIGSNSDTSNTVTIDGGTTATAIQIGNSATAHGIKIGTGAAVQTIAIGSTNTTSTLALNAGTGGLTIQTQGTGTLGIGNNAVAQTLAIGNSTGATSVNIQAGTGGLTIQTQGTGTLGVGNNAKAQILAIGNTTGNTSLALQAGTGGINLGTGGIANTIQIGNTTGAVAQTINIGNNATASSTTNTTIGSTIGTSTTTIQGGTGNILLKPSGGSNTGVIIQGGSNSSSAFAVENTSGLAVILANTANQTVTVGNAVVASGGAFASTATQSLTTGTSPYYSATANLCNNGRTDLATANGGNSTVSVFCNTGSLATPFPATATISLTTSSGSEGVATGNFCGNSRVDIAITNYNAGSISIFCNTGSTGSAAFSTSAAMTLSVTGPVIVTTGNFCNNSRADLAVSSFLLGTISVFCNTGSTGSSAFNTSATMSLSAGTSPLGLTTGNFCNNGRADLADTNTNVGMAVFCNTGSTGSSAFSVGATMTLSAGTGPQNVITGNFCNNGRADLADTTTGYGTPVFCNTGSTGSSAFPGGATMILSNGTNMTGATVGNLCGNGRTDIATTSSGANSLYVYCNTGSTGSSALSGTASLSFSTGASTNPQGITMGNLCNNSRADIVVSNTGAAADKVYCNQIPVTGLSTATTQINTSAATDTGITIQGASSQTADNLDIYTNSNALLDNINANGDLCIAMGQACNGTSALQVNGSTLFKNASNSTTAFRCRMPRLTKSSILTLPTAGQGLVPMHPAIS